MRVAFLIHMAPHVSPLDFSFFSVKGKFGLDIHPTQRAGLLAVAVSSNGCQASSWIVAPRREVVPYVCVYENYIRVKVLRELRAETGGCEKEQKAKGVGMGREREGTCKGQLRKGEAR